MSDLRHVYAQKASSQIPRLLGLLDRNPYSPTYGCFHRDFWLDKTSDFPDAVRQFAVHALAMVYKHDFPGNIYKGQPKIRDWTIAGLDFWTSIQHRDGSFDEFYPYERGWAGPTAFTTFTAIEAYNLMGDELPGELATRLKDTIRKAAYFIAAGESEQDDLANHHAIACLAVWKAYRLLGDEELKDGYERRWQGFLRYHRPEEGWSVEYDGVDPGYLSATVSFLAKIYQDNKDPRLLEVIKQSVEFCSYFVYPNGYYGGSLGSRNTLHFYPHGFEIVSDEIPLAAAVSEKMLSALDEGKLVPPEIISDRYVFYRVPEFLQAYLDYKPRPAELPLLPYEQEPFTRYHSESRIFVANDRSHYAVANLAKGGAVKIFDRDTKKLLLNDCGILGRLSNNKVVTSQWIDPDYRCDVNGSGYVVSGKLQAVPTNKTFTPLRNIVFRVLLLAIGWNPKISHWLKGAIRKMLMLGSRPVGIDFQRTLERDGDVVKLTDQIRITGGERFSALSVGDEFSVRYVPQSRYFQSQELEISGYTLDEAQIGTLNSRKLVIIERTLASSGEQDVKVSFEG